ncbi:MAG: hypothetical protein NVSMB7_07960 [Chitinophagaceae bacterium]
MVEETEGLFKAIDGLPDLLLTMLYKVNYKLYKKLKQPRMMAENIR